MIFNIILLGFVLPVVFKSSNFNISKEKYLFMGGRGGLSSISIFLYSAWT